MKPPALSDTAFSALLPLPAGRRELPIVGVATQEVVDAPLRRQFLPINTPMGWPDLVKPKPGRSPPDLNAARQILAKGGGDGFQQGHDLIDNGQGITDLNRVLMQNGGGTQPPTAYGAHGQINANGWSADAGTATFSGARGTAAIADTVQGCSLSASVAPFNWGASASGVLATPGADVLRGSTALFGCDFMVGAAGRMTWTTGGGSMVGAGVAAFVVGTSDLRLLGRYQGDDAALQNHYLVEFERSCAPGIGFDLGGGAHTFALGGRLMLGRAKRAHARVYLHEAQLRSWLRSRDTRCRRLRNLAQGLGILAPLVRVPDMVQKIERGGTVALRVGESLTLQVTGTICLGLSLGAYGVHAGVYGTYQGESAMTLRRVDEHTVEVVHAPKKELGISVNLDVAVIAEAFRNQFHANVCVTGHLFDLRQPEARQALGAALRGEGPFMPQVGPVRPEDARTLAQQLHENIVLPKGVVRTFVEKASSPVTVTGARISKPFFWQRWGALGGTHTAFSGQSILAHGLAALTRRAAGAGSTLEQGPAGVRSLKQTSVVQRVHAFNEAGDEASRCDGVTVECLVTQAYMSRPGLHRAHQQWQRAFGHAVQPFQRSRKSEKYTVVVQRHFTPGDLAGLSFISKADINLVCRDHPDLAADLRQVMQQMRVLEDLRPFLPHDLLLQARAELLQNYLKEDHNGRRMGAVHFLLGDDPDVLLVDTQSSLFSDALQRAERTQTTWGGDLPAPHSRQWRRALQQTHKAERRLTKALQATNDDQMLRYYAQGTLLERLSSLGDSRAEIRQLRAVLQQSAAQARQR